VRPKPQLARRRTYLAWLLSIAGSEIESLQSSVHPRPADWAVSCAFLAAVGLKGIRSLRRRFARE
jgi:hypothetical protein